MWADMLPPTLVMLIQPLNAHNRPAWLAAALSKQRLSDPSLPQNIDFNNDLQPLLKFLINFSKYRITHVKTSSC